MKYYKFLDVGFIGPFSGFNYASYMPQNGKPGKWLPRINRIEKCVRGYHACKPSQISRWANSVMVEVEFETPPEEDSVKVWGKRIRITRRINTWDYEKVQKNYASRFPPVETMKMRSQQIFELIGEPYDNNIRPNK